MLNFDQLVANLPLVAAVAGSCVVVSVLLATAICIKLLAAVNQRHAEQVQKLENRISVLTSGSLGMGEKMIAFEGKLQRLQRTQKQLCEADMEFSYTQAQKLIARGVDARTITANSGLSASEIHLMQMLHQQELAVSHG